MGLTFTWNVPKVADMFSPPELSMFTTPTFWLDWPLVIAEQCGEFLAG
jgi:hypothetical protein